jgi:hypothetical protein
MLRYHVILVDGKLAIKWEDETHPEAIDRARQQQKTEMRMPLHPSRCKARRRIRG